MLPPVAVVAWFLRMDALPYNAKNDTACLTESAVLTRVIHHRDTANTEKRNEPTAGAKTLGGSSRRSSTTESKLGFRLCGPLF
jgi:hypothetical protein